MLFTAHSLPERILPPATRTPTSCADHRGRGRRAASACTADRWGIAWQSAGRTPEPWLGPDILEVIDDAGRRPACRGVLVCALGFVADHLEVLYDLDIEASRRAAQRGLAFARTACVNDDPAVMAALARRIVELG